MNEYNFNEHISKELVNFFGGSERKKPVVLDDGELYLLKMPDPTREVRRNISYINNSISEYIGCKIFKSLGLDVQDVKLGTYTTKSSKGEEKTYIVCACKNIEQSGYKLSEIEKSGLSSDDPDLLRTASFENLKDIATISDIPYDEILKFYSELFVADALIGNPDRHNGNWAILTGVNGNKIAPIYDCGSSLCPLISDNELSLKTIVDNAANAQSAIVDSDGKRIKYREYLSSGENVAVTNALKTLLPRIDIPKIHEIIKNTPYISNARKEFYSSLVVHRYEMLAKCLENCLAKEINQDLLIEEEPKLFERWKSSIAKLSNISLYKKEKIDLNGQSKFALRVNNKYIALLDTTGHQCEALFPIRSNNADIKKALQCLYGTYNIVPSALKIDIKISYSRSMISHGDKDVGKDIEKKESRMSLRGMLKSNAEKIAQKKFSDKGKSKDISDDHFSL